MLPLISRILVAARAVISNPATRAQLGRVMRTVTYIQVAQGVIGSDEDKVKIYQNTADALSHLDDDDEFGVKFFAELGSRFRTDHPEVIQQVNQAPLDGKLSMTHVMDKVMNQAESTEAGKGIKTFSRDIREKVKNTINEYVSEDPTVPINLDWRRLVTNPMFAIHLPTFRNVYPPPLKKRDNQLFYTPVFPVFRIAETPRTMPTFPKPLYYPKFVKS